MKIKWIFSILMFTVFSCKEKEVIQIQDEPKYFLSDIRPVFFEHLNFDSEQIKAEIPIFLNDFKKTYDQLERQFKTGVFTSKSDLDNMRIAAEYYSFYILALTAAYLDSDISPTDIISKQQSMGLFSKVSTVNPDFTQKEFEAMMERAVEISRFSINLDNSVNDRALGFYFAVRQVQERLKNKSNYFNNIITQDSLINYTQTPLVNYNNTRDWNILMSMVTLTNYKDSANTFSNPSMEKLLTSINTRLVIGTVPETGKLPDILGPLYRYDLHLKKADWILKQKKQPDKNDINQLVIFIKTFDTISNYIEIDRKNELNAWNHKLTYILRKEKVKELKDYITALNEGNNMIQKPDFKVLLNSKEFKKAYTCYGCHQPTGL